MNKPITKQQLLDDVIKILEESVRDFPEGEKEEAKARILNVWSSEMFNMKMREPE